MPRGNTPHTKPTPHELMARIRSVKPEFWVDRKLATRLSRDARLLYISLWNFADEWSRLQGDARYVKGHCLPYDDDLSLQHVDSLLDELQTAGRLLRYTHEGDPYLFLPYLDKHQRLEPEKVPSRLPEPPSARDATSPERGADLFARDATSPETNVALQVAGSRLQVASSRTAPRKPNQTKSTADARALAGLELSQRLAQENQ